MRKVMGNDVRRGERGAVSIKVVLILAFLAAAIFVIVKVVPAYAEQRSVVHEVEEMARIAAVRNLTEVRIKDEIEKIRAANDLPDGSITLSSRDKNEIVKVKVAYNRTIDFLVTSYIWKVDEEVVGKSL